MVILVMGFSFQLMHLNRKYKCHRKLTFSLVSMCKSGLETVVSTERAVNFKASLSESAAVKCSFKETFLS